MTVTLPHLRPRRPALPQGDLVLVLNCGSSSIKFALFDARLPTVPEAPLWQGHVEGIGTGHALWRLAGAADEPLSLPAEQPYHAALEVLRERMEARLAALPGHGLKAVAHRVVHGGAHHRQPVWVDAPLLAELRRLIPLAPLHQPFALEALEALLHDHPEIPQLACFDTAFHHTLAPVEQMLPLDWQAWTEGVRRYGFHGLSYEYIAGAMARRQDLPACARVIAAHLGSGASLCALQGGRSVATTMGFSALDGLMMGSRCGSLDPGALIHVMQSREMDADAATHWLYHGTGLAGLSGLGGDPRPLLAAEVDPTRPALERERAAAALALYVRRIVREVGALTAVLGGLDALVFTAGIGEHNDEIRRRVVQGLGFVGAQLDADANRDHGAQRLGRIDAPGSALPLLVIPTQEEWVAAQHACRTPRP